MYRRASVCFFFPIRPIRPKQMSKEEEEVVLADCLSLESTLCLKAIRRLLSTGNIILMLQTHFLSPADIML